MHLSRFAAALLPVLLAAPVYAQSCAQVDGKLGAHYQEMIDNGSYAGNAADDASGRRDKAAAAFQTALSAYLKDASSWQCKFPQTVGKNGLRIVESSDSKLRTYSWDEQDGGSMHNHTTLAQWRAPSGAIRVKTLSTGEAAPFVSDLIADNFGHYGKGYRDRLRHRQQPRAFPRFDHLPPGRAQFAAFEHYPYGQADQHAGLWL